jgi:hypothetical protein
MLGESRRRRGRRPATGSCAERTLLLDPDADTTPVRRALGVPATTVADWARTQPWAAVAAPAPIA